jgi:acylphosphatase
MTDSSLMGDSGQDRIRRVVRYSGRVQGVGFRYTTEQIATGFEVVGSVRNLSDGRVEMIAQGRPSEVDRFQAALEAHLQANIDTVEIEKATAADDFDSFRIAY